MNAAAVIGAVAIAAFAGCKSSDKKPAKRDASIAARDGSIAKRDTSIAPSPRRLSLLRESGFDGVFAASPETSKGLACVSSNGCADRFSPASTFKVPHALIGLDLGVVSTDTEFKWDGKNRLIESWNRNHTLSSAIQVSAVWYFQELARRIGPERMQSALDGLGYGNRSIGDRIDAFWLNGRLQVSPAEQVALWHQLHRGSVPGSKTAIAQTLRITELGRTPRAVLRGKTGWFRKKGEPRNVGWLTGCVDPEVGDRERVCFALALFALEPFDHERFKAERFKTVGRLLAELGVDAAAEFELLRPEPF